MPVILGANSASGGYEVTNSLRFNSGSSDYINRTFGTATNRKIFTFSVWVKRSTLSVDNGYLMAAGTDASTNVDEFYLRSGDTLDFSAYESSVTQFQLRTTQLFRDVSAWYHLMVAYDSTQATSSNRIKMYVNGSQVTAFAIATYPSLNFEPLFNSATAHTIARNLTSGSRYQDGYLSEFYFIDGQALTPSSFGETDEDTGIWKPKAYTGSFGTNGFYLDFEDSANLGNDMSGNNNDFTVNNLISIDQTTDTPTNNFTTLNALENSYSSFTLTEGNLKAVTANYSFLRSTIGVSTGKWYMEVKCTAQTGSTNKWQFGISDSPSTSSTNYIGANSYQYGWRGEGSTVFYNGTSSSYGSSSMATGDIIGIALDLDNNKLYWSKNGTFINSANPATNTNGFSITGASSTNTGFYHFAFGELDGDTNFTFETNFGNPPFTISSGNADANGYGNFEYAVPSGFYALNSKNLAQYG